MATDKQREDVADIESLARQICKGANEYWYPETSQITDKWLDAAKAALKAIGYAELVEENKTLLKNLENALGEIRILQLNRDELAGKKL